MEEEFKLAKYFKLKILVCQEKKNLLQVCCIIEKKILSWALEYKHR